MSFEDKTLVCRDCGNSFTFTAGEQEFYEQKGFTNEPQRCRDCRQARKQRSGASSPDRSNTGSNYRNEEYGGGNVYGGMRSSTDNGRSDQYGGGYERGNTYSRSTERDGMRGNTDYGNTRYGNEGYARGERVQHETVCAQCGRPTTVPFVPRAGRPVYCQECFAQRRGAVAERGSRPDTNFNRF